MQIVLHCYDEFLFVKKLRHSHHPLLLQPTSSPVLKKSGLLCIKPKKWKNRFSLENTHFIWEWNFSRAKFFVAKCLICNESQLNKRVLSTWNVLNSLVAWMWKVDFPVHCFASPTTSNHFSGKLSSIQQYITFGNGFFLNCTLCAASTSVAKLLAVNF